MHILCPHCHNPIEVVKLSSREEIACPSCGSSFRLETETTTGWQRQAGRKLGRFELLETVGQGAFGTVYKARDPELDRTVAIKVPRAGNLTEGQELDRFLREARSVAQLRHPSIVTVHEVGQHDGVPYLVSDFVAGVTLADLLSARRPSFREAAELVAAVADALQYAHEQGVVHRDVKPSNLMIGTDGRPCVMDFGLARRDAGEITMTVEGQVLGTPAYMSPEQAGGQSHAVDGRSDVYSLGAVLYQLLTGELPFRGTKRMLLHQVLHDDPRPPRRLNDHIPRDLETICLKALAKEPPRRYGSARDLADDLRRWLQGQPIQARPVRRWERAAKWVRRNPALAAMTAVVALTLLAATGVSLGFAIHAGQQAERARQNENDAVAKGLALAAANETLTRRTDDLKRSRDGLERTVARSLLAPLAAQGSNNAVSPPEWEAMWQLAANRPGRLGYRFVEEAARAPVTSRQLADRAAVALPAAVGLDPEVRDEVETLLVTRLADAAVDAEHQTALARAAAALEGLRGAAASRTARHLLQAVKETKEASALQGLAQDLVAVSTRLEPREAADTLTRAIQDTREPYAWRSLVEGLSAVSARQGGKETAGAAAAVAAVFTRALNDGKKGYDLQTLAQGLSAVSALLEPEEAARVAATFTRTMKLTEERAEAKRSAAAPPESFRVADNEERMALKALAEGLSSVCTRLGPGEAATALITAIKDTKDTFTLSALKQALSAASARLAPEEVAPVAAALTRAMKDARGAEAVRTLAEGLAAVSARLEPATAAHLATQAAALLTQAIKSARTALDLMWLAQGLAAVSARLEPGEAARAAAVAAAVLTRPMKDVKNPYILWELSDGLAAVSAHLEPEEATRAAATAADALVGALREPKELNTLPVMSGTLAKLSSRLQPREAAEVGAALLQAMKDTREPQALPHLAQGLAAVAARMEPREAAATLTQAVKVARYLEALQWLSKGLSAAYARLEPGEAAATLTQAMKNAKDATALSWLAQGLSEVPVRLEPGEAAAAAATLAGAMKNTRQAGTSLGLARGVSALSARMEPGEAAAVLTRAIKDTRDANAVKTLAERLSAVSARLEPGQAAQAAAQAAAAILQTMKDNREPYGMRALAESLSAVSAGLETPEASRAAAAGATDALIQFIKDQKNQFYSTALAPALSAVLARLGPREAATVLTGAVKNTREPIALALLAGELPGVAFCLEPGEAAEVAATLTRAIKGHKETGPLAGLTGEAAPLAQGLAAVSARLESPEAARAAAVVLTTVTPLAHGLTAVSTQQAGAKAFALALTDLPPATQRLRSVGPAVAVSGAAGGPFLPLAVLHAPVEPLPCRFSSQQLVELLKMPICVGEARRVVLDHLGNRYHRRFADVWEFVRFAQEQRLDLEFTNPPQRPE
jgi:tRNA A-37 threonylcarbamoyl transferase component Bud32